MRELLDRLVCRILKTLDEDFLFPYRFRMLAKRLSTYLYLAGCEIVLDVGSSDGRLAKLIQDRIGGWFMGADVLVQPRTDIPIVEYDGMKLPFEDESFDAVMMIDMLHHAENQEQLLREAKRVSGRYILIKDHYWDRRMDYLLLAMSDYIGNKPYGVNLPYKYLTIASWLRLFERNGLRVVESECFRFTPLDPCKHVIFKLEKIA